MAVNPELPAWPGPSSPGLLHELARTRAGRSGLRGTCLISADPVARHCRGTAIQIMAQDASYDAFLRGTLLPFLRAFERPIAIACSRLLTLPPLPPRPLFAVPRL